MTAAKFKSFMFSVWGFALSDIAYISIFRVVNSFCLSPASVCYIVVNVQNLEGQMHIAEKLNRERESERRKLGGGSERDYRFGGGCNRNIIWQFGRFLGSAR
jgi:hypothetical protein